VNREKGFTLIELILVIVILGILAATAIPKFSNLTRDAKVAKLAGMQGAVRSGTTMIYSKAVIQGKISGDETITLDGASISLHSGYPIGHWAFGFSHTVNLEGLTYTSGDDVCTSEWCGRGNQTSIPSGKTTLSPGMIGKIYTKGYRYSNQCGVYYINHANGTVPEIGLETDDC